MADTINLTAKVKLKTNPIRSNSMCILRDRKATKIFIASEKSINIYDNYQKHFQTVKLNEQSGTISCLTDSDDLVFFCYGMRIYACGLNGRTLYEADTYLAVDKIEAIHVYGYQLWLVAGNMVNQFLIGGAQLSNKQTRITPSPSQNMQDVNSLIYDVKINHSLLIKNDTQKPFLLLLKNNNMIEVSEKKDPANIQTESPPTYGYLYPQDGVNKNRVLVGTMSGELIYLEVQRKSIKKLWSIKQNSKGRVNCIVEVKNGFMVFRDGAYEMWNPNRQCLGREELSDKIQSAIYLAEEESFFYGTSQGSIVEMFNYEKMMKMARQRNDAADRLKLASQIQELRIKKEQLKLKLAQLGGVQEVSGNKNIKVGTNLTLDYVKLSYSLQVSSEYPIIKLVLRGNISMMEQRPRILFQGNENPTTKVFIIRTEDKKLITTHFKFPEEYSQQNQLICMVHMAVEGKLIANKQIIDLKFLSLYQKINSKLLTRQNLKVNVLRVEGQFKYFLMTTWLNAIFNEIGSPSPQDNQLIELCYESLITKNKIYVEYRDKQCAFYSQSPTPLAIIKKAIFERAKSKNLSLSYQTKTNIEGLKNLLTKMAPKMKMLEQNRKQYELLPGIQQLQGGQLSQDLRAIILRSQQIKQKYNNTQRQYEELKTSIKDFYTNYRTLNNWQVHSYQLDELTKSLARFDPEHIISLIES